MRFSASKQLHITHVLTIMVLKSSIQPLFKDHLSYKTIFQSPMGGLKIEGPLYSETSEVR